MVEFFRRLFDTSDFVPRRHCGHWTDGLAWLHIGSDLMIWLAYVSIPLILLWHARRLNLRAARVIGALFATFILACGFTHFTEALMFYHPAYRVSGLIKLITAVVSWATVFILIPLVPRVLDLLGPNPDANLPPPDESDRPGWPAYWIALSAAVGALLLRGMFDPLLGSQYAFLFAVLAVMLVGWSCGLWPALVTLVSGFFGMVYLFLEPRGEPTITGLADQVGAALYFFSGFIMAVLAASERVNRLKARTALRHALRQRDALESEVRLRREVEAQLVAKQAETAAARAAADEALVMYRTLADAMPQIVWVTRADGYHEYYNRQWYEYTGLTFEQTGGEGWSQVFHPDDQPSAWERWRRSLATGEPYEVEYRARRHDGEYRWFLGRALPQRDDQGRIVRWFGTCTDIHDHRRLQEDLRQSLLQFRSLTEAVPQMVWTADTDGAVTYFNRRWHQYTGFGAERVSWPGGAAVIHPDDAEPLIAAWRHAVAAGLDGFSGEFRLRRADGEFIWHLAMALPLRTTDGKTLGWVGTLTDIHDQKERAAVLERLVAERTAALTQEVEERTRAEERAQAVAVELQRSNRELEAFASVASHDLQEPVRKILAFGDRLVHGQRDRLDDQGRDHLDRILTAAARMRRLIEDLLTYARVTTQAKPFTWVDLNDIMGGVVSDLEVRIAQTRARVEVGPLPRIQADPIQMRQLFQNLVSNALKFTPPDTPPVVRVGTEPAPEGCVRLSFADQGIGFESRYLDRIFQVFQRLHGRTEYEGTGIGLAICKKIVDRHGGTITATSQPGRGTTFLVDLPVEQNRG